MSTKLLTSMLATAFTVSVAQAAEGLSMQGQIDHLKNQINLLEAEVQQQNKITPEKSGRFADRIQGVRQALGYSLPGLGTGRTFGLDSAEDGSETLINAPQLNKDFNLLLQNQFINKKLGAVSDTGARVQFSGTVQASYEANSHPFSQGVDDAGQIEVDQKDDLLAQAEFDFSAQVNDWVTGYMHYFSNTEPNSTVEMEQAFIIFGNLDNSPTYASIGKGYVSSGGYTTNMASRPLTREIGRFRANKASLGTTWQGFRANVFGYDNERELLKDSSESIDQWGAQLEYFSEMSDFFKNMAITGLSFRAGIAYVNDISGAEAYTAEDVLATTDAISEYVPSGNVYARIGYYDWSLRAEYQHNFNAFKADELSMNTAGAKISAAHTELTYRFNLDRPSWLSVSYGQTNEALALQLPERVWGVTYGVNILKNTVLSFEYLLQQDYSADDFAYAAGSQNIDQIQWGTGGDNSQFTAQLDVYF